MRTKVKQSGFGIIEAVIVVAVIGVLAATGWLVYQHNRTVPAKAESTQHQTPTQPKPAQPQPTVTYLTVKEWGIQLPLSDSIKDAYYAVPTGISLNADGKPSGVIIGFASLDRSCGLVNSTAAANTNSIGEIIRALPTEKDPVSGKLYTELAPNGVTIGGYYYGYYSNAGVKTCAPQSTLQPIDTAFAGAAKSARATAQ